MGKPRLVSGGGSGKEAMMMSDNVRYWKPCMTNLPYKLGKEIFEHIRSTPAPDIAKMQEMRDSIMAEILKERGLENAQ